MTDMPEVAMDVKGLCERLGDLAQYLSHTSDHSVEVATVCEAATALSTLSRELAEEKAKHALTISAYDATSKELAEARPPLPRPRCPMSEIDEETIARALFDEMEGPMANQDFGRQQRQWELCQRLSQTALALVLPAIERARVEERERAAKVLDEAVWRLIGGRKRVSQIDQHVAAVLESKAAAIRKG